MLIHCGLLLILLTTTIFINDHVCEEEPLYRAVYVQPEQIHLSLGGNPHQRVLTWTTFNRTSRSTVWYGTERLNKVAYGDHGTLFTDGGPEKRSMYIHRVYLNDLEPNTTYKYHVGSELGWSELFLFRTFPDGYQWSPRFAVYGDLGNDNAQAMGRLQMEAQNGQYDFVWHLGDFAYNLEDDNAKVGDEFMRQIEPIAAYVPYLVTPGNHEEAYNFSNYDNRFTMHSNTGNEAISNFFWSQNIGPVHLISISTEFYYFPKQTWRKANRPENRARQPWIIVGGHRPFYVNTYIDRKLQTAFEELFWRTGVDIYMAGHEHIFDLSYPVYREQVKGKSFANPAAPIYIISGSAGCIANISEFSVRPPPYTAKVSG
ncbi:Acid phosphatase type 7 [Tyrophagus putrescentiae]|nr:Acid phosphatase type 7 [Tyrophagus putrescentiae]